MTGLIKKALRALHILPPRFDEDDMINANLEDKEREHSELMTKLHATLGRRRALNDELRESIRIARERTNSFEDFERLTIRRREQGQ